MHPATEHLIDHYDSPRSQLVVLLLAALRALRVARPKMEVIDHIRQQRWFAITGDDFRPYPTQTEPRSYTLIAWARKQCVEDGLMERGAHNSWRAEREGENLVVHLKAAISEGKCNVRKCFFWTPEFKTLLDPSYSQSEADTPRPKYLYEDQLPPWMDSVRGNEFTRDIEDLRTNPNRKDELQRLIETLKSQKSADDQK